MKADLHLHTCFSDGAKTPAEMIRRAKALGMDVIAITDHDNVGGLPEAAAVAQAERMTVLPGVELSVGTAREIHVLGYGMDPDDAKTRAFFDSEMEIRRERTLAILKKLADRGIEIAPEETGKTGEFMGRMYLAEALCRRGWADSVRDAFNRYIGDGAPCYVPRRRKPVADGIRALRELGAVPVLAHPARSGISPEALQQRLGEWMDAGLLGVEAWHASHMPVDAERFDALARRNGLLVTGGSDCHGRDDDGGSSRGSHAGIGEKLDGWKTVAEDVQALRARMKEAEQIREKNG